MIDTQLIIKAKILDFPQQTNTPESDFRFIENGALVVSGKRIQAVGNYHDLSLAYPHAQLLDHSDKWLLPGLIDSHLHYPQTGIIGKFGKQLLTWLENYTFPTEAKFADEEYAAKVADVFTRQLLRNGTTTGLVFSSVHKTAADALFSHANSLAMQMVIGKVCMDQNCPDYLQDTAASAQGDSADLIARWHGKGRNYYAITPRFAPTSSEAQLAALGELAQQYKDVFIQTHLSENVDEIAWVKTLFPDCTSYLDVYQRFHMVRKRAVFGHCIHMQTEDWQTLAATGATAAFCPTSNLFLGSGLFDLNATLEHGVNMALATDVGGGTSFNLLRTYGEGYKACQLHQQTFAPLHGLYAMTQGPAVAYALDHEVGNLNAGTFADFILLDPCYDELTSMRIDNTSDPQDMLFAMSMLGDDRAIQQTWVAGKPQYNANKETTYAVA